MTPVLFDLPLRLGDAAALAEILLNQPGGAQPKPLTDDFRSRVASRAGGIAFDCMTPHYGSLERDPVHPSAFYICVDGVDGQPLLLRIAPAKTPSSGIFPKAILIGRTFIGDHEVVLNAVPFGPGDQERILIFSEQVNTAFQPRPVGTRPVVLVSGDAPEKTFPVAFEGFRRLQRSAGQNLAAFGLLENHDPKDFYCATLWAAIRSGWREGYALHSGLAVPPIPGLRRRPFETELNITRQIRLNALADNDEILELFA